MKIKGNDTIGYENVVTGIVFARNDPLGVKTSQWRGFKIDACQNMTCAMSEENAVRQLPPALRVLLDARLQSVHAVMLAPPKQKERRLRPHHRRSNHIPRPEGAVGRCPLMGILD